MNILKYTDFFKDRSSVFQIKKTISQQQLAVALGQGAVLENQNFSESATLIILKGEIKFSLPDVDLTFTELDFYEIPIDVEHEITGVEKENLFLIIKEMNNEPDNDLL